jgi:predicted alpha/beta-fold hydrolase
MKDGGIIGIDWSLPINKNEINQPEETKNVMVITHGLTGGSHESYVHDISYDAITKYNLRVVVVNSRGIIDFSHAFFMCYFSHMSNRMRWSRFKNFAALLWSLY